MGPVRPVLPPRTACVRRGGRRRCSKRIHNTWEDLANGSLQSFARCRRHRFFSKSKEWKSSGAICSATTLSNARDSRASTTGAVVFLPAEAIGSLWKLAWRNPRCACSRISERALSDRRPKSFEDWVTNQFGAALSNLLQDLHRKSVGMSCKEISADWAAQRIQGLSLAAAIKKAAAQTRRAGQVPAGQDPDRFVPLSAAGSGYDVGGLRRANSRNGGEVLLGRRVEQCRYARPAAGGPGEDLVRRNGSRSADHVISTAAIRDLARMLIHRL